MQTKRLGSRPWLLVVEYRGVANRLKRCRLRVAMPTHGEGLLENDALKAQATMAVPVAVPVAQVRHAIACLPA